MNNNRTLIGIGIAALIALVAAFVIHDTREPTRSDTGDIASEWLLPELHGHVNDVTRLVLSGAEGKPIATIERADAGGWAIANKGGYAADVGKLRKFLIELGDAKRVEQKTANSARYADLEVGDTAAKDAKGVLVEVEGLAKPVKLVIGKSDPHGRGTYVRRAEEAQSWLASGSFAPDRETANWLRRDIFDLAASRIADVTIEKGDGAPVHLAKDAEGDANFRLADVPKGREAGADYTLNAPASMLSGLRFDDVAPAASAAPGDDPIKARFTAFDGLVLDVVAWQDGDEHKARLSASVDDERAAQHIAAQQARAKADYEAKVAAASHEDDASADAASTEGTRDTADAANADDGEPAGTPPPGDTTAAPSPPPAVSDPDKDRADRRATLDKEVADINARVAGWTFVLPAYKYDAIDKGRDDFLKPLEDARSGKK
jgi:hypothetical protein